VKLEIIPITAVEELWPQMRPMFDRCVTKACHGEVQTDDILELLLNGRAVAIVGFNDDGEMEIAAAFEPIYYPRLKTLNLMALGGSSVGAMDRYVRSGWWDKLKAWALSNGFKAIDAWTSDSMRRVVARYGFKKQYIHNRLLLGDKP
jgi:hypothetical protein